MTPTHHDTLIIGAGMAGLSCAVQLANLGHRPALIDKGRGPGGRMAARRAEIAGAAISFDHGAQYFTSRTPDFRAAVADWEAAGAAARWEAAGADAFVGVPGMNGPIRAMADRCDVRWGVRAISLTPSGGGWQIATDAGELTASIVLLAIPAEQASELLSETMPDLAAIAASVRSSPCWAAMAAFAAPLPIADDTLRSEGPIAWAARNSAKPGRKGAESWVIHASQARSRELINLPKTDVANALLADFFALAGLAAVPLPLHLDAHRWLYALPETVAGPPAHFDAAARIGIAGDYLHSPRVEGAWLSGRALANLVTCTV